MTSPASVHFGDRDLTADDLMAMLDGVADGITALDTSGRLIFANAAAAKLLGVDTPEQLVATEPADIFGRFDMFDEYGEPVPLEMLPGRRAIRELLEFKQTLRFHDRATGTEFWSAIKARPVLAAKGKLRFVINIWQPLTELMEHQRTVQDTTVQLEELTGELEATVEELQLRTDLAEERAERQRFLAEAGRLLASSLDHEETLRMVVQLAVPRMADWATVSLVQDDGQLRQIEIAHSDPDKLRFAQQMQERYPPDPARDQGQFRVLRTGEAELYPEIPAELLTSTAQDAEHLRLLQQLELRSAMIVPMKLRDKVLGVITFVRAETTRSYSEEDLEFAESLAARAALAVSNAELYHVAQEANRVKADFLAVMSHELRTPLTAIFGYTELMATGVTGPMNDQQIAHLERIHSSASHLLTIIEDILNYARAEAGKDQITSSRFTLTDVVTEAVNVIKPAAEKKRLQLTAHVLEEATVVSDRPKIRQILLNLLGNAVKFTDEGTVALKASALPDNWFMLEVEDTGPGIGAADHARIFEPFQQLQPSMTRTVGGTGLGLAVSRRFAQLLGGSIEVGTGPSGGAVFTVRIPSKPLP